MGSRHPLDPAVDLDALEGLELGPCACGARPAHDHDVRLGGAWIGGLTEVFGPEEDEAPIHLAATRDGGLLLVFGDLEAGTAALVSRLFASAGTSVH